MDFLNNFLEEYETSLPEYLKKLLMYKGFDNIFSISKLKYEHIQELERFGRDDLKDLLTNAEIKSFYGIYYENIAKWSIPEGHKEILIYLQEQCAEKVRENQLKKEQKRKVENQEKTSKDSAKDPDNQIPNKRIHLEKKTIAVAGNHRQKETCGEEKTNEQIEAESHVRKLSQAYLTKFCEGTVMDKIKKKDILDKIPGIEVHVDMENYFAQVKCCLCDFRGRCYSVKNTGIGRKWVLSNVNKHFRTHFKDPPPSSAHKKSDLCSQKNRASSNTSIMNYLVLPSSQMESNDVMDIIECSSESTMYEQERNTHSTTTDSVQHYSTLPPSTNELNIQYNSHPNNEQYTTVNSDVENLGINPPFSQTFSYSSEITDRDNYHGILQPIANPINNSVTEVNDTFFGIRRIENEAFCSADPSTRKPLHSISSISQEVDKKHSRNQRKISSFNVASYCDQTKITDYFVKKLAEVIDANPNLNSRILDYMNETRIDERNISKNTDVTSSTELPNFLVFLKDAADLNSNKRSKGNRYESKLKLFSLYIFIVGGRLLYETLYNNLKKSLPSITTLHRYLDTHQADMNIEEGIVRVEKLKEYLLKRKCPLKVFISEDQTALIKGVRYDSTTNRLIGFVSPLCENTGFPKCDKFYVHSARDIEKAFSEENLVANAYVFMAQPMVDGIPAFTLATFGSDNKFTSRNVLQRWQFIEELCHEYNIEIVGFSSDGDSRCLKSMKIRTKLPSAKEISEENPYSPYFQMAYGVKGPVLIQDTVHIGTKLKTKFLKPNNRMAMGSTFVSSEHIRILIQKYSKDKHLLSDSYLNDGTFKFPREENSKLGKISSNGSSTCEDVIKSITNEEILECLKEAHSQAEKDADSLGVILKEHSRGTSLDVQITNVEEESYSTEGEDKNGTISMNGIEEELSDSEYNRDLLDTHELPEFETLDLKDFSQTVHDPKIDSSFLKVILKNGKELVVRKSSLCWLFSNKQSRLSSDRIYRVRGTGSSTSSNPLATPKDKMKRKQKKKIIPKNTIDQKQSKKSLSTKNIKKRTSTKTDTDATDTETDTSFDFESESEFENESFEELTADRAADETRSSPDRVVLTEEKYYAVYYDNQFYLDSKIVSSALLKRQKATKLVVGFLAPAFKQEIINDIKQSMFTIIVDETTVVSRVKSLVIIMRSSKAEDIFSSITNLLNESDVPIENVIGFADDNSSTMMGALKAVQAKFKATCPDIYVQGCTCHSPLQKQF
ncbi:unnamed protein product [Phaedon cochleariae]|uniref:Uncharacterized protein n=1 Tax=Phaedon cochleariae TaxID=80249 RepID=A0A9N9X3G1_PHACE|nr:unnamed protein product [Phaedon cochleariae]